jgi:hypothetical protein
MSAIIAPPISCEEASTNNVPGAVAEGYWRFRGLKPGRRGTEPIHSNDGTSG